MEITQAFFAFSIGAGRFQGFQFRNSFAKNFHHYLGNVPFDIGVHHKVLPLRHIKYCVEAAAHDFVFVGAKTHEPRAGLTAAAYLS
jgi:hypothetical protein